MNGNSSCEGTATSTSLDLVLEERNNKLHREKIKINTSTLDSNNDHSNSFELLSESTEQDKSTNITATTTTAAASSGGSVIQSCTGDGPIKATSSFTDTTNTNLAMMDVKVLIPRPSITDRYGFTANDRYILYIYTSNIIYCPLIYYYIYIHTRM